MDLITGTRATVREIFWLGFGDLCYVPDQFVKPINNIMTGQSDPIPIAIKRMPKPIIKKYFPDFLSKNISAMSHLFEEVGDCNRECRPIPKPTFQMETEQGRSQKEAFVFDNGEDTVNQSNTGELKNYYFWLDLIKYNYCSPYVTSY